MHALYDDLAWLYDLIYHWKDYEAEGLRVAALLEELGVPRGGRVLEGAVGTGRHLQLLANRYQVQGFDSSPGMLAQARRRLPHATLWEADLIDFNLDEPVHAFLCLFSSVGYLQGPEAMTRFVSNVSHVLVPGGVALIEPWLGLDDIDNGRPGLDSYQSVDLHVARASSTRLEGDVAVVDMQYLIARRGEPVTHRAETHRLWCAPEGLLEGLLRDAGMDVRFEPEGLMHDRGLVVARKR